MNTLPKKRNLVKQTSQLSQKRTTKKITDPHHLSNTKCRRTKNLTKKSVEISKQCGLDIIMIIFDRNQNRFKEIYTNRDFTLEQVDAMIKAQQAPRTQQSQRPAPKHKKIYARDIIDLSDDEEAEQGTGQEPEAWDQPTQQSVEQEIIVGSIENTHAESNLQVVKNIEEIQVDDTQKIANKRQRTTLETDSTNESPSSRDDGTDSTGQRASLKPSKIFQTQVIAPLNVRNMLNAQEISTKIQRLKACQIQARIAANAKMVAEQDTQKKVQTLPNLPIGGGQQQGLNPLALKLYLAEKLGISLDTLKNLSKQQPLCHQKQYLQDKKIPQQQTCLIKRPADFTAAVANTKSPSSPGQEQMEYKQNSIQEQLVKALLLKSQQIQNNQLLKQ